MFLANHLVGFGARGKPRTVTKTDSGTNTTNTNSYTFSAKAITTPGIVVVGVTGFNATSDLTVLSFTIGGFAANAAVTYLETTTGGTHTGVGIYYLYLDTGTTADVAVTFSGTQLSASVVLWSISGDNVGPNASGGDHGTTSTTFSVPLAANESHAIVAIGCSNGNGANRTCTWDSPIVEDYDAAVEGNRGHTAASILLTSTITAVTGTYSGALNGRSVCAASWA